MSAVYRLRAAAIALLGMALAVPAHAREDDVWITIERAAAHRALAGLGAAGRRMRSGWETVAATSSPRASARATSPIWRESSTASFRRCGGFVWHATREAAERAAERANEPSLERTPDPPTGYTIDNGPVVQALIGDLQEINVRNTIVSLGSFFTRYHNCQSGLQSGTRNRDRRRPYDVNRRRVTVEFFSHTRYTPQPSVIITITGIDLPNEVVVLGGHRLDRGQQLLHQPRPGRGRRRLGRRHPHRGASAWRWPRATGPQRTVKFMAYAARRSGCAARATSPTRSGNTNVNVVGVLQLDMTNYKGSEHDIVLLRTTPTPRRTPSSPA